MINSLSIGDLFWSEIEDGRISFRFHGMAPSVHFTISWENENNINLHITKNIGDGTYKPKIVIAKWDKDLVNKFIPYIPALIIGKIYEPLSFKIYSRRSRKNIRIIYLDEIENHANFKSFEKDATGIFKKHSVVKRKNRLKIKTSVEKDFLSLFSSGPIKSLFLNNLRTLHTKSFKSPASRCGIIFLGNKKHQFVTYNNRCYILKNRKNFQEFLKVFMKPELVDELTVKVNEALIRIKDANTYADTLPYNNPHQLYLES